MCHDDAITQKYIDEAYGNFSACADPVEQNYRAFVYLRGTRRRGDEPLLKPLGIVVPDRPDAPFDQSLADAEHYMYARYLASKTGDLGVKALVTGYELKKYVDSALGREQEMRTNKKFPVLPASVDSIRWGIRGADDGLQEYRDAHGGKTGSLGSAVEANADFIKGALIPKLEHAY